MRKSVRRQREGGTGSSIGTARIARRPAPSSNPTPPKAPKGLLVVWLETPQSRATFEELTPSPSLRASRTEERREDGRVGTTGARGRPEGQSDSGRDATESSAAAESALSADHNLAGDVRALASPQVSVHPAGPAPAPDHAFGRKRGRRRPVRGSRAAIGRTQPPPRGDRPPRTRGGGV